MRWILRNMAVSKFSKGKEASPSVEAGLLALKSIRSVAEAITPLNEEMWSFEKAGLKISTPQ